MNHGNMDLQNGVSSIGFYPVFSQTHNCDETMSLLGGCYHFESPVTHPSQNIPKLRVFVAPT